MLIATNISSTFHEVWLLLTFFFTGNFFLSESEIKTQEIKWCDFGGFQSPENEKKKKKSLYLDISFSGCSQNIEMMIKDLYLFIVYSQIWLNLPRDDITFLNTFVRWCHFLNSFVRMSVILIAKPPPQTIGTSAQVTN